MPSIALITEGLTDQIVIARLIRAMYEPRDDGDRLQINPLQPLRDTTDAFHAPHAGWEKVFEYCEHSIEDALATNDYVVVHIDTDEGDHPNYGLPLTQGGADRPHTDLIDDAKAILTSKMGDVATEAALARIIFAVAVHATESWLLLIIYGENKLKSPFERLVRLLQRKEGLHLKKEGRIYSDLMRTVRDRAIHPHSGAPHSLGVLLPQFRERIMADSSTTSDDAGSLSDE